MRANIGDDTFDKNSVLEWFKRNNDMDQTLPIFHTMGFAKLEDSSIPLLNWWYEFKNFQREWSYQKTFAKDYFFGGAAKTRKYFDEMAQNRINIKNNIQNTELEVINKVLSESSNQTLKINKPYHKVNGNIVPTSNQNIKINNIKNNKNSNNNLDIKNLENAYIENNMTLIKNRNGEIGLPPDLQENYDELVKQLKKITNENTIKATHLKT